MSPVAAAAAKLTSAEKHIGCKLTLFASIEGVILDDQRRTY
jgi:hypothetical protein